MNWKQRVKQLYDEEAESWVVDTTKQPLKYYYFSQFNGLFGPSKSQGLALDVGCGAGTFTFELADRGYKTVGLDISERMLGCLNREKKKRKTQLIAAKGDIEKLPFENNSFDFVLSVGVMEILKDRSKVLSEIFRVLKPEGKASIRWLNRKGVWGRLDKVMRAVRMPPAPFSEYSTTEEAKNELSKAGFKTRKINGMVSLPFFMFPRPISWILELVFVKTGFAKWVESLPKNTDTWCYSFCTRVSKE